MGLSPSNVHPTGLTIGLPGQNGQAITFHNRGNVAPFSINVDQIQNSDLTWDDNLSFGYNNKPGGRYVANVENFGLTLESNYRSPGQYGLEYNFNYVSGDSAMQHRYLSFYTNKLDSKATTYWWMMLGTDAVSNFRIFTKANNTAGAAQVEAVVIRGADRSASFYGTVWVDGTTDATTNLKIGTAAGGFGALEYGGTTAWLRVNQNLSVMTQLAVGQEGTQGAIVRYPTSANNPYTAFSNDVGAQVYNSVLGYMQYWGHNMANGDPFAKITASRPAFGMSLQQRYRTGGKDYSRLLWVGMPSGSTTATTFGCFTVDAANNTEYFWNFQIGSAGSSAFGVYASDGTTHRIKADTTGIGFFNASPVAKPTVSGSRGSNAALASLITALANLGLVTDSSS